MASMSSFRILRWGSEELPSVVCLHDLRGHARRFERLARMLEPGRMVVAYDLRGHGRSPWSGPHTMLQHIDDLPLVLERRVVTELHQRDLVRLVGIGRHEGRPARPVFIGVQPEQILVPLL